MSSMVVKMAYHKQVPWHGEGFHSDRLMTAQEIVDNCDMGFEIVKKKVKTDEGTIIPDVYALFRDDLPEKDGVFKGITVGKQFTPFQPREFVEFFAEVTENVIFADRGADGDVQMMETGGVLKAPGRVLWMLAKLPGEIVMPTHRDDAINKYLLLCTFNDGSGSTKLRFCGTRVVCWNTLSRGLRENEVGISVRHTKNAKKRLVEAKEAVGIMNKSYEETAVAWEAMARKQILSGDLKKYIAELFPGQQMKDEKTGEMVTVVSTRTENIRNRITELHDRDPYARGTLWGAFGAVTEFVDHEKSRRGTTDRGFDVLFGSAAQLQSKAFDLALKEVA